MTTLGRRQKRLWEPFGKRALPGVACPSDAKPAPPAPLETPWNNTAKTLAERARPAYTGVGIGRSKRKFRLKRMTRCAPWTAGPGPRRSTMGGQADGMRRSRSNRRR